MPKHKQKVVIEHGEVKLTKVG